MIANNTYSYKTVSSEATAEYKDRGSRFIGYVMPVTSMEDIKAFLKQIKSSHPKAVHYCYAYRLQQDNSAKCSDDGEPAGSAGRPILGQIERNALQNVLVIVVRYFGGSLLGVPGLINAYKSAALLAIEQTEFVEIELKEVFSIWFEYRYINEVMRLMRQFDARVVHKKDEVKCNWTIEISKSQYHNCLSILKDMPYIELDIS